MSSSFFNEMAVSKNEQEITEKRAKERERLRTLISTELAEKAKDISLFGVKDEAEITKVKGYIKEIIEKSNTPLPLYEQEQITHEKFLEITSLGKIHKYIEDQSVSEIMINAPDEIWVERKGKLELTDVKFRNDEEVLDLAKRIANHVGRLIDNTHPIVDARLPDGSRVNIVVPPISMKGVTITIRKFFTEKLTVEDLIRFGSITKEAADFLRSLVVSRMNIIVSGGTGSGKTTTLNIVSNFVPNDERIITIEDSAELQLHNDHVVKLESRPSNAEGTGEVTIRDLVKTSLRMRPERIIVGEVRDGTAFDLLQAMNTGHDGSMATVHSNNPDACVARVANLVLQAGFDMSAKVINEIIAEAVDVIVQITRLKDGSRKITHITEVAHFDHETGKVTTKNIFEWKLKGFKDGKLDGELLYTGYRPTEKLIDKMARYNQDFDSFFPKEDDRK